MAIFLQQVLAEISPVVIQHVHKFYQCAKHLTINQAMEYYYIKQ